MTITNHHINDFDSNKKIKKLTTQEVEELLINFDFSILKKPEKNKGRRGQLLELALGIPNGSSLKDMSDGELKTFKIGQTICITQLNHCLYDIINNNIDFDKSKVFEKLKCIIYVAYDENGEFKNWTTINLLNDIELYSKIKKDYEYISSQINFAFNNKKHIKTITGPNKILQIRTKAQKTNGIYTPLIYNNHTLKNKYMAFYLCATYGKKLFSK